MTTKDGRPETLVSFIERRIERSIAQGDYQSGSRLSPSVLAKEYEVSHIPVREALSSLAAKGYIEHRQAKGFFTRNLTSEELADIYHWRTVLETEALRLAMPKITDGDLAEMREILAEESAKTDAADRLDYLELNRKFHFVAFKRAESPILLNLLNNLWDISRPYVASDLIASTQSHKDHVRQVEIFETGDVDAMLAAMEDHRKFRVDVIRDWEARQSSAPEKKAPAKRARKSVSR